MSVQQENFKAIADAIREKTGETELIKPSEFAGKVDDVYAAGQSSMVDTSKLIPKTVSGSYISVDDVSEIPHSVACKVESMNLLNPANFTNGELVEYNGVQCYKYTGNGDYFVYNDTFKENTQYTLSYKIYAEDGNTSLSAACYVRYVDGTNDKINVFPNKEYILTTSANKTIARIEGAWNNNRVLYIDLSFTQLNEGTEALPYTPYVLPESVQVTKYGVDESEGYQTLTPAADGTVEGMTSVSPYMNIFSDTEGVNIEATYNKSYGMQTEYDRFWDSFQQNGTRTNYRGMFAGTGWNTDTFNPKYKTTPSGNTAIYMFHFFNYGGSEIIDFQKYKHLFDFSEATNCSYLFANAWIDYIDIDLSNATILTNAFVEDYDPGKKTHLTIKTSEKCTTYNSAFNYCLTLTDLFFAEGSVIAANIAVSQSPLTAESLVSVVEHLSDTATGKTATFKQTAINNADWTTTEYASWDELIATKPNWAFAYA